VDLRPCDTKLERALYYRLWKRAVRKMPMVYTGRISVLLLGVSSYLKLTGIVSERFAKVLLCLTEKLEFTNGATLGFLTKNKWHWLSREFEP
jgi:hypothetical protein